MSNELAPAELSRLEACERVIERGMTTFVEVGEALADIRDSKLYRASHKTFDEYCRERWGFDRTYAYRLMDGAKTVQAMGAAAPEMLPAVNKLPERQIREMKADPVAAVTEIKERAAQGEEPAAVAKDIAARSRAERQAQQQPKQAPPPADDDELVDRIEELEAINEDLAAENAILKAQVATMEPMRREYERGGFAEVIASKDEQIRVLKTRVESESREKVKNLRSMEFWREKARERGYSRDAVIDLETGEVTNG